MVLGAGHYSALTIAKRDAKHAACALLQQDGPVHRSERPPDAFDISGRSLSGYERGTESVIFDTGVFVIIIIIIIIIIIVVVVIIIMGNHHHQHHS